MKRESIVNLTYLALFVALILILAFTPLGYLKIVGVMEITFIGVPVLIGALILGPSAGALLGLVFGLTSLASTPSNPLFGPLLPSYPVQIALMCIVPRVLVGLIAGWLGKLLKKTLKNEIAAFSITALVGSLANTVLFIGSIFVLMYKPVIEAMDITPAAFTAFWVGIGATNGIPEAIACVIIVTAATKAITAYQRRKGK